MLTAKNLLDFNNTSVDGLNKTDLYNTYLASSSYNGHLDVEFLHSINPHWIHFPPPEPWIQYTLAILYIFIMIIGMIGNALVIFMFIRCRILRTAANILIINLAISDFIMIAKAPIFIYNSFKLGPALGFNACRIYGFIGGLTGTVSITTLTAISIDRYYVIVYPFNPIRMGSDKKLGAIIMIACVWTYSFFFAVMPALDIGFSKYVPEGFLTSCSFDYLDRTTSARIFMFVFFLFAWLLPLSVIVYCYVNILRTVRNMECIQSNKSRNRTEYKLALVVINVIGLWFIAWTPYSIVALIGISGNEKYLTPLSSMIPALFCKTSACINPYLYSMTHPRFKKEISRFVFGYKKQQLRNMSNTRTVGFVSNRRKCDNMDIEMEETDRTKTMDQIEYMKEEESFSRSH